MRKLGTMLGLSLLASPALLFAQTNHLPRAEVSAPPVCDSSDCLILKENDIVELSEVGEIKLEKVLEDSRCPVDAVCIWGGRIKVKLSIRASEICGKNYIELGLGQGAVPTWTDEERGLSVSLDQVWPEKMLQGGVKPLQLKIRVKKDSQRATSSTSDSN